MSQVPQNPHDQDDHNGLTFEVVEDEHHEGGRRTRHRGIYLLPNLFTTAALGAGFYAIISAMAGRFEAAAIAIFVAALFDGMDGRIARMTNTQSAFGAEYDSLSDMVSFGVAPALVMFSWALQSLGKFGWICAFLYAVAAAFRLARFNVQLDVVDKRYFIGLASPLAASIVAAFVWVGVDNRLLQEVPGLAIVAALVTVAAGFLMVSNVKYYSFKELDRSRVPFVVMLPVVLVFGIVMYNLPIGILAVSVLYAVAGPVAALWNRWRGVA
ncbi:CDP-diacylglycerol--serine O-phosphatidyltransferase [Amnimonas aquatica]|uniref:CDP-diacylglycerol--serine O-phosphatidyltransferase n=1 Tax=Amnimonas aquatica TaxID=2094561 RepID=A0A2P6ARN3_9GAMM|nr:CDP-diacylglycerol--serine O-phosphatidyltransferase [Amnimonas aquatica]PQA37497.1 CDP-diacylglycerol--serine O-phosphatidyltransferase [Amnimonas aquatica]